MVFERNICLGGCIREYSNNNNNNNIQHEYVNKIKGAMRGHFGKQMNKETKLRIHNITAKAALKIWK